MNMSKTVEMVDMIQSCSLEDLVFLHAYLQLKINKRNNSSTNTSPLVETPVSDVNGNKSLTLSSDYIPTVLEFDTPKTENVAKKWSEIVTAPAAVIQEKSIVQATPASENVTTRLDSRCAIMVRGWDPTLYQWQDVRKWFTTTLSAPLGLMNVYVNKKGYALLKFTNTRDAEKAWKMIEVADYFQHKLSIKWNK